MGKGRSATSTVPADGDGASVQQVDLRHRTPLHFRIVRIFAIDLVDRPVCPHRILLELGNKRPFEIFAWLEADANDVVVLVHRCILKRLKQVRREEPCLARLEVSAIHIDAFNRRHVETASLIAGLALNPEWYRRLPALMDEFSEGASLRAP